MFCPTDLYQAARPRSTVNDESAWTAPDQGECNSDEPSRTEPDDSHPAENRKVGGSSIASLATDHPQRVMRTAARGASLTVMAIALLTLLGPVIPPPAVPAPSPSKAMP